MMRPILPFRALWALMLWAGLMAPARADEPAVAATPDQDDVRVLADRIDELIAARWAAEAVVPAPPADDYEFLRRVSLAIAGRIPSVAEVRAFAADSSSDKRRNAVERLLDSSAYMTHFANTWRSVMIPEAASDFQVRFLVPSFESWLRTKAADNAPFDVLVRQMMTVSLSANPRNNPYATVGQATPLAFYQAKQIKPENLAAATSRIFLGLRIECAQCHDHPFDTWSREQFWSYAAFFAGIERGSDQGVFGAVRELFDRREVKIPDTETVVQAAFLDGTDPRWQYRKAARGTLADWITSKENPYFARATANRVWAQLFGVGLVDPVDDFSVTNPPSHPELLDELAAALAEHDFDLKFLIRAIMASRTYQLTSRRTDPSQDHPRLFARMPVKGMLPEQLYESLGLAVGVYEPFNAQNPFVFGGQSSKSEILELFRNDTDPPTEQKTTILQALALMNGKFVADATSLSDGSTLAAVAEFPGLTTAERIETLFLATLSRPPTAKELERMVGYVERGGPQRNTSGALGDVFWALLNSSEFLLSH